MEQEVHQIQERDARNLANVETSSGNLLNLINDILACPESKQEVGAQQVDVRTLADECADALEST